MADPTKGMVDMRLPFMKNVSCGDFIMKDAEPGVTCIQWDT